MEGRHLLSEEAAREQSIFTNYGEPIPPPRTSGDEIKNPNLEVIIYENWIFRSRRSHRPYPYDTADKDFKDAIRAAWQNKDNKTYREICKEIASKVREILDHTIQKQTYYCMIVEKKEDEENGFFSGDE